MSLPKVLGHLSVVLSCSRSVSTSAFAKVSPTFDGLRICCRVLSSQVKGGTSRNAIDFTEESLKEEVAKPQADILKVYRMHQAIVNQYSVDLKKEKRAAVLAMGLVKEKEARIQESSGIVLAYTERLQMSQAKVMRLEGRFDMRGLIEVVEQKYKDKYDADPNIVGKSMKHAGREELWRAILTHEQPLVDCLKNKTLKGFDAVTGPFTMVALYRRLSGFIHTGVDVYTTGEFVLPILLGPLSPEEAKALQCLADDVSVRSEIHAYEPTSRHSKEVCSHSG